MTSTVIPTLIAIQRPGGDPEALLCMFPDRLWLRLASDNGLYTPFDIGAELLAGCVTSLLTDQTTLALGVVEDTDNIK